MSMGCDGRVCDRPKSSSRRFADFLRPNSRALQNFTDNPRRSSTSEAERCRRAERGTFYKPVRSLYLVHLEPCLPRALILDSRDSTAL